MFIFVISVHITGTIPSKSSMLMHSALLNHFAYASSYPVGGSSEIAMQIIPVIERSQGRVLVRANGKYRPLFFVTVNCHNALVF